MPTQSDSMSTTVTSRRPIDHAFLALVAGARIELRGETGVRRRPAPLDSLAPLVAVVAILVPAVITASGAASAAALRARCKPIHYVVDTSRAPAGGREAIAGAFGRLSAATGIPFIDDGDVPPATDVRRANPVLLTWTDHATVAALAARPDALGVTGTNIDRETGEVLAGAVVLDADAQLGLSFDRVDTWGGVLLHELGHLVGLRHSPNPNDVMYPDVSDRPAAWGPTERMLLRGVGQRVGCTSI